MCFLAPICQLLHQPDQDQQNHHNQTSGTGRSGPGRVDQTRATRPDWHWFFWAGGTGHILLAALVQLCWSGSAGPDSTGLVLTVQFWSGSACPVPLEHLRCSGCASPDEIRVNRTSATLDWGNILPLFCSIRSLCSTCKQL